ncbi:beta strand repeat-containing protein [Patescibacteria group bacterium]
MKKFIKSKIALQILASSVIASFALAGVVSAATTIGANVNTAGTLTVTGTSALAGAVTLDSTLEVTGTTTLTGAVTTVGNLTVGGTINSDCTTVTGSFTVGADNRLDTAAAGALGIGTSTATSISIGSSTLTTTFLGLVNVDEAVSFDTTLLVTGVLTTSDDIVSDTTLTDTLGVTGTRWSNTFSETFTGENITLDGGTTGDNLMTIPTNQADAFSVVDSAGDLIVFDTTTATQVLNITPKTAFVDDILVGAGNGIDTSVAGTLYIGTTTANAIDISTTTIMTTVKGTLNVDEAVTFDTTLNVTGNTNINDKFIVLASSGNTTASGTLGVLDDFNVNGLATTTAEGTIKAGTNDWGTGATGIALTTIGSVIEANARVNTDLAGAPISGSYGSMAVTNSQSNGTSLFGSWNELYIKGTTIDLTGSDNYAGSWGHLEMEGSGTITSTDTGDYMAGVAGSIKIVSGTTFVNNTAISGVRVDADMPDSGITGTGRFSAFECDKVSGASKADWDFGLYMNDVTTDIRMSGGDTFKNATASTTVMSGAFVAASYNFADATAVAGDGDDITLNFVPDLAALAAGLEVKFLAEAANTGAATLAIDGGTAKAIIEASDLSALDANDIRNAMIVHLVYDGTQWQQISQSGN